MGDTLSALRDRMHVVMHPPLSTPPHPQPMRPPINSSNICVPPSPRAVEPSPSPVPAPAPAPLSSADARSVLLSLLLVVAAAAAHLL